MAMRGPCLLAAVVVMVSADQRVTRPTHDWQLIARRPAEDEVVRPIFMLRHDQHKLAEFEQLLWDVSTPGNPKYGKHLSREEVAETLPPTAGAKEAVLTWLEGWRVESVSVSATGDMIQASLKVHEAEKMFSTQFHRFKHRSGKYKDVIRATTPHSIPATVASKVYLVGNIAEMPALRTNRIVELPERNGESDDWPQQCGYKCGASVTPQVLQQAYKLGDPPKPNTTLSNTTMAVAEFQGVDFDLHSLQYFQKECTMNTSITVDRLVGPNSQWKCKIPMVGAEACSEALLDIEYIKAVAGDIPLTNVEDTDFSLLNWAKQLDDLDDLPPVHSVSYGNDEIQQSSQDYMDACNAQFMKLGVRGVSVLFASGDQGVWGRSGPDDGKFHPDFPGGSPYVTMVGGTDFVEKTKIGEEKAWASGGGGFSNHFPAPAYQQAAIKAYKNAATAAGVLPPQEYWNATGRAYPDVAALGGQQNPYCVSLHLLIGSTMMGIAGTSASCPVVAGLIARLNAIRKAHGKPSMGFLNPFIYQNPQAFNDVKQGKNNDVGDYGFTALPGWDPATGVGTPNFPKLQAAALAAVAEESTIVV